MCRAGGISATRGPTDPGTSRALPRKVSFRRIGDPSAAEHLDTLHVGPAQSTQGRLWRTVDDAPDLARLQIAKNGHRDIGASVDPGKASRPPQGNERRFPALPCDRYGKGDKAKPLTSSLVSTSCGMAKDRENSPPAKSVPTSDHGPIASGSAGGESTKKEGRSSDAPALSKSLRSRECGAPRPGPDPAHLRGPAPPQPRGKNHRSRNIHTHRVERRSHDAPTAQRSPCSSEGRGPNGIDSATDSLQSHLIERGSGGGMTTARNAGSDGASPVAVGQPGHAPEPREQRQALEKRVSRQRSPAIPAQPLFNGEAPSGVLHPKHRKVHRGKQEPPCARSVATRD